MRKNFKSVARKSFALLMTAVTVMCGMPSVDAQAETAMWTVYDKGTPNPRYTDSVALLYLELIPHSLKASMIESTDIEAYVNVEGTNVRYWDIARERYLDFYGLASTSVKHRFNLVWRSSRDYYGYARFFIDATHMNEFFIMEGDIWN